MAYSFNPISWDPAPWSGTSDLIEGELLYVNGLDNLVVEGWVEEGASGSAHVQSLAGGIDTVFVPAANLINNGNTQVAWQNTPPIQLPFGNDPIQLPTPQTSSPPPPPPASLPQGRPRIDVRWSASQFQNLGLIPSQGVHFQIIVMSDQRRRGGYVPAMQGENYYDSPQVVADVNKVLYKASGPTTYRVMIMPMQPEILQGNPDYAVSLLKPYTFTKTHTGDPTGVVFGPYNVQWKLTPQ